jgi:hypothetical protein
MSTMLEAQQGIEITLVAASKIYLNRYNGDG